MAEAKIQFTPAQAAAIRARGGSLLVSAAAGSGKTRVLVERVAGLITDPDHPVDADSLLIMTFTNAAAAEMRERVGAAIENALEQDPYNQHLQRQLTLVHNAQITTIDSFCIRILRENAQTQKSGRSLTAPTCCCFGGCPPNARVRSAPRRPWRRGMR